MSTNVYVTRRIPDESISMLEEACDVVDVNPHDRALTRTEFLEAVQGRDGLLCLLTETVDDEVLDAAAGVKGVANYAVGFNNIDVDACTRRGIPVSNTPDVLTDTTADLAWALMFSVARRIVEGDRYVRDGKFKGWGPLMLLGDDLTGKTLGIVGGGRIGMATAARAVGFSMPVLYTSRNRHEDIEAIGAQYRALDDLLQASDFVSIHVPLMPETTHLIGPRELNLMKSTAYLINTARGPIVDEKALVTALRNGIIAGAGLDVFEREPELEPGLADLDNAVIVPHVGSGTVATRIKMGNKAATNLIAMVKGEEPSDCVNPEWKQHR
ncbi:MAG TPA: D-glycerate dehydrogenase [candidate division Zixibacteria bacterium]|nr:D-glycerate dehydrogenase [candidate division Zixibacteria bacterium]